jgi:hypothetical protein
VIYSKRGIFAKCRAIRVNDQAPVGRGERPWDAIWRPQPAALSVEEIEDLGGFAGGQTNGGYESLLRVYSSFSAGHGPEVSSRFSLAWPE